MRYAQIKKFKDIGEKGTALLQSKTVTVAGLGNIGSTVSTMLIRSGINLRIIDKGRCDPGDLDCQSVYIEEDMTKFKAKQAKKRLEEINPRVKVKTFHEDLNANNIYLIESDIIIDATGNLETSKLISDYAKKKKIPVIYGLASGSQGVVATSDAGISIDKIKPLVSKMKGINEEGLINPVVHMACSIIANNAMKLLLGKSVAKDAVVFDIWNDTFKHQKI